MKKLSSWAKSNPYSARVIIVISYLLVVINAIFLGVALFVFGWEIPQWPLLIAGNVFFLCYLFYPSKSEKNAYWNYSYKRQKTHDFGLVLSYVLVIVLWANHFCAQQDYYDHSTPPAATAKFMVLKPSVPNVSAEQNVWYADTKEELRRSKKALKRELRALKKEFKRSKDDAGVVALKVLLILLTVFVALLLTYLIAALSCSLSCSGQGGLAAVVLILGLAGIIWLGVIAIKNIIRKVGPSKEPATVPEQT